MNKERNEFLTRKVHPDWFNGILCYDEIPFIDFSTPDEFYKLFKWSQEQDWWGSNSPFWGGYCAYSTHGTYNIGEAFIDPDKFADTLYEFLRRNDK